METWGRKASILGLLAVVTIALAGAAIFLLLTNPLLVAGAVSDKDVSIIFDALVSVLSEAWQNIVRFL